MKRIILAALVVVLAGCETMPVKSEQVLVKHVEYIVKIPPADLLELPPSVASLNFDDPNIKQSDVGKWIVDSEQRSNVLENKLIGISKFLKGEQDKLDDKAKTENVK